MTAAIEHLDVPRFTAPALCAEIGGDEWYPDKGGSVGPAKKVCDRCEARAECLAYALDRGLVNGWDGVWGGTSPRERRVMLRSLEAAGTEVIVHPAGPRRLEAVPEPAAAKPTRRRAPRPWTTAEAKAAVRALTAAGFSASQIASELGISDRTVQRVRRQARRAAAA